MSVETETGDQAGADSSAADDAALAEALAGYNARGAATAPPAAEPDTTAAQPEVSADAQPVTNPADAAGDPPAAPASATPSALEERLAAFKEEIRASASQYTPEEVRKLHGQIGEMNRKLQQMEKTKADIPTPPPAPSPLDAAIAEAELAAEGFPEVAGPLVAALKLATQQKPAGPATPPLTQADIDARADARAQELFDQRQAAAREEAIAVLRTDHPDFQTVADSPEFDAWILTRPAELRSVIRNTENPVLAARFMSEFKSTQQAKQKKMDRLEGAITPTGTPSSAAPSQPTDMELALAGYNKGNPRPIKQR